MIALSKHQYERWKVLAAQPLILMVPWNCNNFILFSLTCLRGEEHSDQQVGGFFFDSSSSEVEPGKSWPLWTFFLPKKNKSKKVFSWNCNNSYSSTIVFNSSINIMIISFTLYKAFPMPFPHVENRIGLKTGFMSWPRSCFVPSTNFG